LARGDLTDAEWRMISGLLPAERGRKSRPSLDNRRYLNGMLHVLRVGCPWRDMHERYGRWNSVYVRFRRWAEQGVWDALLETLVELGLADDWRHMVDSTTVRGHSQAAGAKGGLIRKLLVDHAAVLRQNPRPHGRSGTSSWLHPDRWGGFGLQCCSRSAGHAGRQAQIVSRRQGLR
jgi:transposase